MTNTGMEIIRGPGYPTSRLIGQCATCIAPVAVRDEGVVSVLTASCFLCGSPVQVERIWGRTDHAVCDARCMGASGPSCSCSCGGENHGGRWVRFAEMTASEREVEVLSYRAAVSARSVAARKARATRAASAELRRAARLRNAQAALLDENPDVAAWYAGRLGQRDWGQLGEFLADMFWVIRKNPEDMTPRRLAALKRSLAQIAERAAREAQIAAEQAAAGPVAAGKAITVSGVVLAVKESVSQFNGRVVTRDQMLVRTANGSRVLVTVPKAFADVNATAKGDPYGLRGRAVEFTADVAASPDDETFGLAKRPRNARFLEPATA
jgi:hypothetical protein